MDSTRKDGGPAFPSDYQQGMSLRDYFAAAALTGLITRQTSGFTFEEMAKQAYRQADCAIKEGQK